MKKSSSSSAKEYLMNGDTFDIIPTGAGISTTS